jgi:hypothetical protein
LREGEEEEETGRGGEERERGVGNAKCKVRDRRGREASKERASIGRVL